MHSLLAVSRRDHAFLRCRLLPVFLLWEGYLVLFLTQDNTRTHLHLYANTHRYTKNKDSGILNKVNMHTFGKKTMRINQRLFHSQKEDVEFQIQERKLIALETVTKKLIKRITDYCTVVRELYESQSQQATLIK